MERFIRLLILMVSLLIAGPSMYASEYGHQPEMARYRYVISPGKKLNVRSKPSTKGTLIGQLRPGDIVYVDSIILHSGEGYEWLEVSDQWGQTMVRNGYVTNLDRFVKEVNPLYEPPLEEMQKIETAVESSHVWAKWILLVLSIIAAIVYIRMYFKEEAEEKILGYYYDGMRKLFFFNVEPYMAVIYITAILAAAVLSSIVVMIAVGGVVYALLWIVKVLCYILMWVGIISCIAGIIATICGALEGLVAAILGGIIWYFSDKITAFGDSCAETGLKFFNEFNLFGFTWDLCVEYWKPALICICIPLAAFLVLALLWMIFAGTLILLEKIMTSHYNIKHPCPHCQQPSEPATYLSLGENGYETLPNDIQLRPGMYGLFHITNPYTGKRMPTMLLNGRDKLARYCNNCGKIIQAEEGTEMHIAMVGSAQSGKSTLTYRLIAELYSKAGEDRVEFTDEKYSLKDRKMVGKIHNICTKGRIDAEDLPIKTAVNDLASTQVIIKNHHRLVPHRLFINDVGGELFDPGRKTNSEGDIRYFRNVNTILMMIDPITTDLSDHDPSESYNNWLENCGFNHVVKLPLKDLQTTIDNKIAESGNDAKDIHLNLVLPKKDLGYIPADVDILSQESLKKYLIDEMGLGSLLHWSQKFASCSIYAVGATSQGKKSNIELLFQNVIIKQLGIKI